MLIQGDFVNEVTLRTLIEKSVLNNEISIQTGGDKQRVNIISKFNKSQNSQSRVAASLDNSFQVLLDAPPMGEVLPLP